MSETALLVTTVTASAALVAVGLLPIPRRTAEMLVLTRREKETVVITTPDGTEVRVTVVEWDRTKVRLAFTAPKDVTIDRLEVHQNKQAEKG